MSPCAFALLLYLGLVSCNSNVGSNVLANLAAISSIANNADNKWLLTIVNYTPTNFRLIAGDNQAQLSVGQWLVSPGGTGTYLYHGDVPSASFNRSIIFTVVGKSASSEVKISLVDVGTPGAGINMYVNNFLLGTYITTTPLSAYSGVYIAGITMETSILTTFRKYNNVRNSVVTFAV